MAIEKDVQRLRSRAGLALVFAGRRLAGIDDDDLPQLLLGPDGDDQRAVLTKTIDVVVSRHAILRYGERTGRLMGERLQLQEIGRVWAHAQISATPPPWFHVSDEIEGTLYASIADLLIPLVPYAGRDNTFVATTVLARVGDRGAKRAAGLKWKRNQSGSKTKRRKWSEGARPAPRNPA
jgi:hypothetical protein